MHPEDEEYEAERAGEGNLTGLEFSLEEQEYGRDTADIWMYEDLDLLAAYDGVSLPSFDPHALHNSVQPLVAQGRHHSSLINLFFSISMIKLEFILRGLKWIEAQLMITTVQYSVASIADPE